MNPLVLLAGLGALVWYSQRPRRNPSKRKPKGKQGVGAWQPDLFHGQGIKRPEHSGDRATELVQARREMMDTGSPSLFDFLEGRNSGRRVRRNVDAFRDESGVVHPIRSSKGYDSAVGDAKRAKDRKREGRTLQQRTALDREIAEATGVRLGRDRIGDRPKAELLAEAEQIAKRNKKRAGVRALVKKYGAASAARIVKRKSGRTITEAPPGFDTPAWTAKKR